MVVIVVAVGAAATAAPTKTVAAVAIATVVQVAVKYLFTQNVCHQGTPSRTSTWQEKSTLMTRGMSCTSHLYASQARPSSHRPGPSQVPLPPGVSAQPARQASARGRGGGERRPREVTMPTAGELYVRKARESPWQGRASTSADQGEGGRKRQGKRGEGWR